MDFSQFKSIATAHSRVLTLSLYYRSVLSQVTEVINKVAKSYNVKFISGAKMHQLKHYIINGNKTVVTREVSPPSTHYCNHRR
jgi:hypothetical protein